MRTVRSVGENRALGRGGGGLEEGAHQGRAGLLHARVLGADDLEEAEQVGAGGVPVRARGPAHGVDQPQEAVLDVPADQVDPQALRLWSTVNGEPRQDSSTADMIFSVAEIVHHLSQYMVLEPGDLINTGTPDGLSDHYPVVATFQMDD